MAGSCLLYVLTDIEVRSDQKNVFHAFFESEDRLVLVYVKPNRRLLPKHLSV
jgi:hypothetical protein